MKRLMMLGALALATTQAGAQIFADPLASTNSTIRALDESARDSAFAASERLSRRESSVKIDSSAALRAERGTRCYAYDDAARADPYDPVYRDGAYYCERTGPGVAARVKVKAGD